MKQILLTSFLWFCCWTIAGGQITGANEVRKGNHVYKLGDFVKAEEYYRKSLQKGTGSVEGEFNLANSLYKQKKYKESAAMYKSIAESQENKLLKSKAYYNLGNSMMEMEDYQNSVNAYKNALRYNPEDDEARKNLLLAMSKLQEQQQQDKKDQDKKDDQQQDQKQDQQEQQQNQDQQKKEEEQKQNDQQNKDQEKQEQEQQQQQQQQQPQMSKEEAQRILDALNNDEKDIQDKLKKKKVQGNPKNIEKDW